jgi:glycosyltransferase
MGKNLKVSIVTGTYNSQDYISDCVKSVNTQNYGTIEHIIIDGASKDNTIKIIKSMPNRVSKIISEPDDGIYDAMNKGLQNTTGDVVGILNSDDFYIDSNVISKVVEAFETTEADCVFGDLYYVEQSNTDKIVRKWVTGPYKKGAFKKGWHPAHPSFFVKRKVYEEYGYFNTNLSLAADFELMLRLLEKYQLKHHYISEPLVKMRIGGATSSGLKNTITGNKEVMKAFRINNLNVDKFYPFKRLVPKLKQFIK